MKYLMKNIISNLICFSVACFLTVCIFGSQVKASDNNCPRTLLDAILRGDSDVVRLLVIDYGADPNASLENCQFPFSTTDDQHTVYYGYYDNYLSRGSKLLHVAAYLIQYPDIYDFLSNQEEVDVEVRDHRGFTPEQLKQERLRDRDRLRPISRI